MNQLRVKFKVNLRANNVIFRHSRESIYAAPAIFSFQCLLYLKLRTLYTVWRSHATVDSQVTKESQQQQQQPLFARVDAVNKTKVKDEGTKHLAKAKSWLADC